jgi:hypothetical protein
VRIPLDYYRIIGLPLQSTADQIEQAYQDRLRQTPHSEYTQGTLDARQELLDWAYQVLSDPEQRSEYDANYLLTTYDIDDIEAEETITLPHLESAEEAVITGFDTPKLEVETPQQLVGALSLLYELGEYQRVRSLGEWLLANPDQALMNQEQGLPAAMEKDLILTVALSCWELGRELWRQEQYEAAAEAVARGKEILVDWDFFPELRQEMTSELNKLSPYRIFELLSQRDFDEKAVAKGITLLQDMFIQRGGIDGEIPDESGLNVDEFLHFVQQIREYLTAQEQEELFAKEAQRSSVATYLAACAGIARGFAYLEPHYIRKGKQFLQRLEQEHERKGNRADVYLEESICALLLGETETALYLVEKSQETEAIAQIQAYAAEAGETPDLLLGLCHYAEEWLESVLFPKFLDLADQPAALKDYFASEWVQQTLESFQGSETAPAEQENISPHLLSNTEASSSSCQVREAEEIASSQAEQSAWQKRRYSRSKRSSPFSSKASRMIGLLLVTGVGLGAIALVSFGLYRGVSALWSQFAPGRQITTVQSPPLALELNTSPVPIPNSVLPQNTVDSPILNRDRAEEVIRTWLSSKAQALGPEHRIDALNTILTAPLLESWQYRARIFEQNNSYQQFRHSVSIESLSYPADNPNAGEITATVREVAKFYRNGQQIQGESYDSTLKVRYDVVRENQTWRIQEIAVLEQ